MIQRRNRVLATVGWVVLLLVAIGTVGTVSAAGTRPDVMGYDDVSTSCTGGSNYWFQNSYENLGSLGWNDRISRFQATSSSSYARWHEDAMYGGYKFYFGPNGCDTNLTNNPLFTGSSAYWNDRISALDNQ